MPEPVNSFPIADRTFRIVQQSTIEHDVYMMLVCKAAGIHGLRRAKNESPEDFAVRTHTTILESGQTCNLLGGVMLPAELSDLEWSKKIARETAEFCSRVTDEESKRAMHLATVQFTAFFAAGLLCTDPFRIASEQREKQGQPATAKA